MIGRSDTASPSCRITFLVDDHSSMPGLSAEHGLACFVETPTTAGLFDTGQSSLFIENARALGVDLAKAEWVVLSHGHYDHTGGLEAFLRQYPNVPVYAHSHALRPRYARDDDGSYRGIGIRGARTESFPPRVLPTDEGLFVAEGLWVTGTIPRRTQEDGSAGRFYVEGMGDSLASDPFVDDQALVIESGQGIVVLLGCAHAGVENTVRHVQEHFPDHHLHAVVGGMHLHERTGAEIGPLVAFLQGIGVKEVGPAHCTGDHATGLLKAAFGKQCVLCETGTVFAR